MLKIFIGLLFLFIDYSVKGVSVTPGFVGYILIWLGMGEVKESFIYQRSRTLVLLGCIVNAAYWGYTLFSQIYDIFGIVLMSAAICMQLLTTQNINNGILELQNFNGINLGSKHLLITWNIMAFGSVATIVGRLIFPAVGVMALMLYGMGSLGYMVFFFQTMRAWKRFKEVL